MQSSLLRCVNLQLAVIKAKIDGIQAGLSTSQATAEDSYQLERLLHQDAHQRLQEQRAETKQTMAEALLQSQGGRTSPLDSFYPGMDPTGPSGTGALQHSQPGSSAGLSQQQAWAQYHVVPKLQQETHHVQSIGQAAGGWSGWQQQSS